MRILHVASEIFPLVKTGGLADVVASLPPALVRRGLDVRVLLPGFPGVLDGIAGLEPVTRIGPVFGAACVTLCAGRLPDSRLPAYVIDAPFLFSREGNPTPAPTGTTGATTIAVSGCSAGRRRTSLPANSRRDGRRTWCMRTTGTPA
jgi:starch synthase